MCTRRLFPYSPYLDVFVVLRFVAGVLSLSLSLSLAHTHTHTHHRALHTETLTSLYLVACESSHLIEFKLTDHIATSVFEPQYIVRYRKGHRAQTSSVCSLLCRESIERIVLDPAGSFLKSFLSYSLFFYTLRFLWPILYSVKSNVLVVCWDARDYTIYSYVLIDEITLWISFYSDL